ncbi:putative YkwD family protein [Virgibacillus natechei]|uniref:YkwD family protein n=1 Tax=Virgibacillus natechei TaxID=1216297 RepID=A0ABS4II55_9BACI|nr:CAP domain-containing protein [Virgibacillus natechei]MBP1970627.1 putative YkwD family protein [Virgibacillus natechei]UZD13983.1 CAP domain-containing protein [Virgibacillus natechei]
MFKKLSIATALSTALLVSGAFQTSVDASESADKSQVLSYNVYYSVNGNWNSFSEGNITGFLTGIFNKFQLNENTVQQNDEAKQEDSEPKEEQPAKEEESEPKEEQPAKEEESEPKEEQPAKEEESEPKEEQPAKEEESEPKEEQPAKEEGSEPKEEQPAKEEGSEPKEEQPAKEEDSEPKEEQPAKEESEQTEEQSDQNEAPVEQPEAPAPQQPSNNQEQQNQNQEQSQQLNQFEQEVVDLTNQERANHGLSALEIDEELSNVARDKSADMADSNYFSHDSPTHGSPFDMMDSYGVDYRTAGENIAKGQQTPAEVVDGWMNSDGHRANILSEDFTHIGVGYVEQGNHWTQQFIGK